MTATHSKATPEWYTPEPIVEAARYVMGAIDLDPASNQIAQRRVCAATWCGLDHEDEGRRDGFRVKWTGSRVFVNPPTPPKRWWEYTAGSSLRAIYVAYSIEQLQQSANWPGGSMLRHLVCVPHKRLRFDTPAHQRAAVLEERASKRVSVLDDSAEVRERIDKERAKLLSEAELLRVMPADALVPGEAPAHASAIVGVRVDESRFCEAFGSIGTIVRAV